MGDDFELSVSIWGFFPGDACLSTLVMFSLHPKIDVKELLSFWLV